MIRKIALGVAVAAAAILGYAATRPDSFRVERTVAIKAPPEKVFPLINDLKAQSSWSPWEKKDPEMKRSFSGPAAGKGAVYEWDGNREIGKGRIEITDSVPLSKVILDLHMLEPMEGRNVVEFTLGGKDGTTAVTWAISGPMPYVSKVIGVFCSMDSMIGKEFEAGLAELKAVAEK